MKFSAIENWNNPSLHIASNIYVMILFIYWSVNILIIGLFLYSKLTPYKSKLTGTYLSIYNFFEVLFNPILNFLRRIAKPLQVGSGIAVDMSQIILLVVLLIILKFAL